MNNIMIDREVSRFFAYIVVSGKERYSESGNEL